MPLNIGDRLADHISPFDQGCEGSQWAIEGSIPFTTSFQDHFLSAATYMNIPSNELYSPLQIVGPWDESLHQDMEGVSLPSFPNNERFNNIFQDSNSLILTEIESGSIECNFIASSAPVESARTLEPRKILPKPLILPSDISGIETGEGSEEGSSKSSRRRRLTEEEKKATANMRRLGNCARCVVRKTKVYEESHTSHQPHLTLTDSARWGTFASRVRSCIPQTRYRKRQIALEDDWTSTIMLSSHVGILLSRCCFI